MPSEEALIRLIEKNTEAMTTAIERVRQHEDSSQNGFKQLLIASNALLAEIQKLNQAMNGSFQEALKKQAEGFETALQAFVAAHAPRDGQRERWQDKRRIRWGLIGGILAFFGVGLINLAIRVLEFVRDHAIISP